ncbi:MAG: hypothetical protein QXV85_05390 [Candidatus Bathyarchaeia archaeon]
MVVYVNLVARRRFSYKKFNEKLAELGSKATFINDGITKRGTHRKVLWHHNRYKGGVEIGEFPESRMFDVSIRGAEEDLLTGAFIGWIIRHFCKKIELIQVFPENARSGWTET